MYKPWFGSAHFGVLCEGYILIYHKEGQGLGVDVRVIMFIFNQNPALGVPNLDPYDATHQWLVVFAQINVCKHARAQHIQRNAKFAG